MSLKSKDVTVIAACKDAGRFLHPSLRSIAIAIEQARIELKISIELIVAMGTISEATEEYLQNPVIFKAKRVLAKSGSLIAAKNQAVSESEGKFIAMISGDDLVSRNWLCEVFKMSTNETKQVVLHPETVVSYGDSVSLYVTPNQEDPDFSSDMLWSSNPWPSTSFGVKKIFVNQPFTEINYQQEIDYSDWHWVCQTVANDVVHKPVSGTLSCCHQKDGHACILPGQHGKSVIPSSKLYQLM